MSVAHLAERLRRGELTPTDAVEHYLARIDSYDGAINSYISVDRDRALAEAAEREQAEARGPLWGVPVAVKDVIDVAGTVTTAGSSVREGAGPAEADSQAVSGLRRAGAVVLGKLNTHEFAYGAMTTSPRFGPAHNPWSLDRIVGGSSGGSGAATAADLAAGTLGTDTAGSVRIPACFNGVTGLRPTTGRVSNRGVFPVSYAFDTVGPLAHSAEDCALLLAAIAGRDAGDPTTTTVPVPDYRASIARDVAGMRIGVVRSLLETRADSQVADQVVAGIAELGKLGATLVDVEVPHAEHFGTIQQAMQFADATEVHRETLRTSLDAYGADVRARLLTGLFIPSPVYALGQRARRVAYAATREVFRDVDALVAPTMPVLPPRIGEDTVELNGETTLYRLTIIPFNSPWSLVGLPVLSVPVGFVDGLPVGMAIIGWRFAEDAVFRIGHAFQQVTDWHERRPDLDSTTARAG